MNVLLLRGLARESRHWGPFPEVLETRTGLRVHCLDLPGVGTESEGVCPASVDAIVADLRARWAPLANGERWILLAVSFGGMIAMGWCHRYPADFERVVLVNTSASNLGRPHQRLRPGAMAALFKSIRTADPFSREEIILGVVSNEPDKRMEVIDTWARYAREQPISRHVAGRQIIAALRFRAPPSLPIPALVLASANDRFVAPVCSERLARRLGAPLVMHPTAGHVLSLDDPEWLADQVATWIAD